MQLNAETQRRREYASPPSLRLCVSAFNRIFGCDSSLRSRSCVVRRSAFVVSLLCAVVIGVLFAAAPRASAADHEPTLEEPPLEDYQRDHWAYVPLKRVAPPAVSDEVWVRNGIDRFVLAKLEDEKLRPMPPASRQTLIRRLTFDLTGLPPTPEEVDAFLADTSPGAYERLADRLLASSAYGERWAQHWLDVARYADTDGFEHDKVRPDAWRYRDWVIDALNRDLPYDEFVRQQIAGDELYPGDRKAAVATGFLLCGPDMPDQNIQEQRRHEVLNEMTSTVGAVFLGMQIGCAECHDHKYDPISQADFYRLRGVFESAALFDEQAYGRVMHDADAPWPESHLMLRGDFRCPGPVLEPAFPRIANPWGDAVSDRARNSKSSGRRAALAEWLSRDDHPLVTRVIVNRLWQAHFGEGLSRTANDFGFMGDEPAHLELVDWLAGELVRQSWSLKAMHRLMVNSATYRQASRADDVEPGTLTAREAQARLTAARESDPDNRLLGRMQRRRIEGETIRDALLAASANLSTRRGGAGVMPPLPSELLTTIRKDHWLTTRDIEDHRRRSIYLFVRRNLRFPLFEAFDRPDTNASCARRSRSTTATQALVLINSELSLEAASKLADYVQRAVGDDSVARTRLVYRRALSREPSEAELHAAAAFLSTAPPRVARGPDRALVDLCLAVFNLNEFVYVD